MDMMWRESRQWLNPDLNPFITFDYSVKIITAMKTKNTPFKLDEKLLGSVRLNHDWLVQ